MDAARDSEENRKGNCSTFVRCIEPQASILFVLSDKPLIVIDLVDLRYDDLASSIVVVDPPTIYCLVRTIQFVQKHYCVVGVIDGRLESMSILLKPIDQTKGL